jgi:hypothetical protein
LEEKRMARKSEPVAFAEVGSYLHENQGQATVKTYTSVNETLKVDPALKTRQIGKVRVEMHVTEDRSVGDNQIYEKNVTMHQIRDNIPSGTTEIGSSPAGTSAGTPGKSTDGLTPLQVLKNFVDNIASDVRLHTALLVGIGILAAAGVIIAIMK